MLFDKCLKIDDSNLEKTLVGFLVAFLQQPTQNPSMCLALEILALNFKFPIQI